MSMELPVSRIVLITGATSGIGWAVAETLLEHGYAILGVASQPEKAALAQQKMQGRFPQSEITFFSADLSSQTAVRKLAGEIQTFLTTRHQSLYALVNNAGAVRDRYEETADGIEYTFALNHLGGFLLTNLLLPQLADGLVVFTSSYAHYHTRIHWKDPMFKRGYFVLKAYKQSKLCNVMTAAELNRRGTKAFCVDPGLVQTDIGNKGTHGLARLVWSFQKRKGDSPEVPAKTFLFLLEHPETSGLYFRDSHAIHYNPQADHNDQLEKLWAYSERLCEIFSKK